MTPFEITLICILSFIGLTFLLLTAAWVILLLRVVHLLKNVEHKVDSFDYALESFHRGAKRLGRHVQQHLEPDENPVDRLVDAANNLTYIARVGVEIWKEIKKGRR
jgi:hypothetical protein